jgi:hypothetical protein
MADTSPGRQHLKCYNGIYGTEALADLANESALIYGLDIQSCSESVAFTFAKKVEIRDSRLDRGARIVADKTGVPDGY